MTYQKILSAEEDDGKIRVRTQKGINLMLKDCDVEKARKQLGYGRPIQTSGQKKLFAKFLSHRIIDVSSLGGPEEKDIKEIAKEANEMSKTKKVEWKFDGNPLSISEVYGHLKAVREGMKDKSNFKGFTQVKRGEGEEKLHELTIMANFDKDFTDKEKFDDMCVEILKAILGKIKDLELISFEIKE